MFEYKVICNTLNKSNSQEENVLKKYKCNFLESENYDNFSFEKKTLLKKYISSNFINETEKINNKKNNKVILEKKVKSKSDNNTSFKKTLFLNKFLDISCYTISNNNFLSCILSLISCNFSLLSNKSKMKEIDKVKHLLLFNLDNTFKTLSYKKKGFNKNNMQNILSNQKNIDYSIKYYICDYYQRNIFILNTNTNRYEIINDYNTEYYNNLILKKSEKYDCVLNNNQNNNIPDLKEIFEKNFDKQYTFPKTKKHNFNKYGIEELRKIATQNNVDLFQDSDKKKKKKKSDLISELKIIFN